MEASGDSSLGSRAGGHEPEEPALSGSQTLGEAKNGLAPIGRELRAQRPLTKRETEILSLVAAGLSNGEISERLFVSQGTVKLHLHNVCSKLGASSRWQATVTALSAGLLPLAAITTSANEEKI